MELKCNVDIANGKSISVITFFYVDNYGTCKRRIIEFDEEETKLLVAALQSK